MAHGAAGPIKSEAMRVLVCVDGGRVERLLDQVAALVPPSTTWVPLHVIDARPRVDLGMLRAGMPGVGALPEAQRRAIESAGNERAQIVIQAVEAALRARGVDAVPSIVRTGEPGRAICAAALEQHADLVALFASRHIDRPAHGPESVGHTARFVVDHAPCPVLVLRELRDRASPIV